MEQKTGATDWHQISTDDLWHQFLTHVSLTSFCHIVTQYTVRKTGIPVLTLV